MRRRTNIALGLAVGFYFLPHVTNQFIFLPVVLLGSLIPDADALITRKGFFKKERKRNIFGKVIKSYVTAIVLAIILAFSFPKLALPLFLGYSFTLYLDTFSRNGIQPFWPFSKRESNGGIETGGRIDNMLFYIFVVIGAALFLKFFL